MSVPSWPSSLPQYLSSDSFTLAPQSSVVSSSMDIGPPKIRRRFTGTWSKISASLTLSADQWTVLWTFYDTTLAGGVLTFSWVHPVTRASCTMRFDPESVPAVTDTIGASAIVTLALEIVS